MTDEHTHAGSAPHEHEGDAPGHTHDAPTTGTTTPVAPVATTAATTTAATTTAPVDVGPSAGGLSMRILLTLLGVALMIGGAFLGWFNFGEVPPGAQVPGAAGIEISWKIFYDAGVDNPFDASFFTSAGFISIILGLLALLGLALSTGWLTRLAGVLAIVAIVAYAITLYRVEGADLNIGEIGLGAWFVALGGLIVLIAGFLGNRRVVTAQVPAA
jgi:hypothetical protein